MHFAVRNQSAPKQSLIIDPPAGRGAKRLPATAATTHVDPPEREANTGRGFPTSVAANWDICTTSGIKFLDESGFGGRPVERKVVEAMGARRNKSSADGIVRGRSASPPKLFLF